MITTLVLTGLRWERSHSLDLGDIDAAEQRGVLRVRRSHVRGAIRNTTKTGKRRMVPFPAELATVLADHRRRMVEAEHPGLEDGWVFANGVGKPQGNGSLCAASTGRMREHYSTTGPTKRAASVHASSRSCPRSTRRRGGGSG